MRRRLIFSVVLITLLVVQTVYAHEVRPGYLELRQIDADAYATLWKVPAVGKMPEIRATSSSWETKCDCVNRTCEPERSISIQVGGNSDGMELAGST